MVSFDTRLAGLIRKYRGHEGHRVANFDAVGIRNELIVAAIDIDRRACTKWNLPAGTIQVPHLCHKLEQLVESQHVEYPRAVSPRRLQEGPSCERCYSPTKQCEVCAGYGVVQFTFGNCTECAGTGWVCEQDGKYWRH